MLSPIVVFHPPSPPSPSTLPLPQGAGEFIVAHYSGECTYHIDASWCELNNELPSKDLSHWLSASSNPVTQQLAQVCPHCVFTLENHYH